MKLAILSRAPTSYSTSRLKTAALDRGHTCKVLNTMRFAIDLSSEEPDLQFRGRPLSDYDAVLPRIGASITYFGSAVVRQFEQMDVYTPNTANGITNSRDKLRAIQILSRHDIGIPATAFVRTREDVLPAIERVGGAPVVIKLLEGTQGIGVILAPDNKVASAIVETLQSTKQNVLIQQFVAESKGRDIRALVVGDRVVGAMRRTAQGDEFRSNVHRGGEVLSRHGLASAGRRRITTASMPTTIPNITSPSTAAPNTAVYTCAGSLVARWAYVRAANPTPRTPVEISETITPMTAAVAASLNPGTMCGTAAGNRRTRRVVHHEAA